MSRLPSMRRATGLLFLGLVVPALLPEPFLPQAHADAPGQWVYSKEPSGMTRHLTHPLERYQRIERYAFSVFSPTLAPMALIREDGTLALLGMEGKPLGQVPEGTGRVLRAAVSTKTGAAIREDGTLVRWPVNAAMPALPEGPWADVCANLSWVAGLSAAGTLYVWDDDELVANTGAAPGARSISLGLLFGATLDDVGTVASFGFYGQPAPSIPRLTGIKSIRFPLSTAGNGQAVSRAAVIRNDGTLMGVVAPFNATTPSGYVDLHIGVGTSGRLVALRGDGVVDEFLQEGSGWAASPTQWYGRYDSIFLTNTNDRYGVWSYDTDRNGEEDAAQIARGEIDDVNGDGIDDQLQLFSSMHDADSNGVMDAADSATICGAIGDRWDAAYYGLADPSTVGFFSVNRVPPGGRVVRGVTVRPIRTDDAPFPMQLRYCIWRDPNRDGSPDDAVLLGRWDYTLENAPSSTFAPIRLSLPPTYVGEPGDVIFHGFISTGPQAASLMPMIRRGNGTTLETSGGRSTILWGQLPGHGHDETAVLRSRSKLAYWDFVARGYQPQIALSWGERRPLDCDSSGVLDEGEVKGLWQFVDVDADGIIDSCERDCDSDGTQDLNEILGGAVDCDRDLLLDSCEDAVSFDRTVPVPPSSEPLVLEFESDAVPPSTVSVRVQVRGDFGAPTEFVTFQLGDLTPRVVYDGEAADCDEWNGYSYLNFSVAEWTSAIDDGVLRMTIRSSSLVDPAQCPDGYVRVSFAFNAALFDCDQDGVIDRCEVFGPDDCDGDGIPDSCEIANGAPDIDGDGRLDTCAFDCNRNGLPDAFEIEFKLVEDCDGDGLIDACQGGDCDADGIPDRCEVLAGAPDCNHDQVPDDCQGALDCDGDGTIDECEAGSDCNADGVPDGCQILWGAFDKDLDGRLDSCEYALGDFDLDDSVGAGDLAFLLSVWGSNSTVADLSRDGIVGGADLSILLSRWGPLYP